MDARLARDAGEHLGGVGELRLPFRTDEAGCFDALQAGGREPVDQFDFVGGGDEGLLVLQAVARADFDDADVSVHAGSDSTSASATSAASASTKSPATARTSAMVPARGAFRLNSIFIASITITSWPASTPPPVAALTTTPRPGTGATTFSAPAPAAPRSCRSLASGRTEARRGG